MKLVKIDPPGTILHNAAVLEMVQRAGAKTFVEVGCGAGDLSVQLCRNGLSGMGIDFSQSAIQQAAQTLKQPILESRYDLVQGDIHDVDDKSLGKKDIGLSMMVMEHVEDDVNFIRLIARLVRPGGHVLLAVPGRRDRWSFEDETVGHLRRYDREDLEAVIRRAGLEEVQVWSVAVPVANLLFRIGSYMVQRSSEANKVALSQREQTETSGIREIPFKTVFPPFFKVILNSYTLWPLIALQRLFYGSGLGLTMLGMGKIPDRDLQIARPETDRVSQEVHRQEADRRSRPPDPSLRHVCAAFDVRG